MYLNCSLQRGESNAIHCNMRRLLETLVMLHGLKIFLLLQTPPKKKEYNKDLIYSLTAETLVLCRAPQSEEHREKNCHRQEGC